MLEQIRRTKLDLARILGANRLGPDPTHLPSTTLLPFHYIKGNVAPYACTYALGHAG